MGRLRIMWILYGHYFEYYVIDHVCVAITCHVKFYIVDRLVISGEILWKGELLNA
jgi:hypothetical protein